jgi:hypothetical protein
MFGQIFTHDDAIDTEDGTEVFDQVVLTVDLGELKAGEEFEWAEFDRDKHTLTFGCGGGKQAKAVARFKVKLVVEQE